MTIVRKSIYLLVVILLIFQATVFADSNRSKLATTLNVNKKVDENIGVGNNNGISDDSEADPNWEQNADFPIEPDSSQAPPLDQSEEEQIPSFEEEVELSDGETIDLLDLPAQLKGDIAIAAPTALKSRIHSDTTVNLEWTHPDSTQVDSFEIYKDDLVIGSVSRTKTFYTVTGLSPGTTYSFKIRALGQNQMASEFSETIAATTLSGKQVYEFEQLEGLTHSGDRLTMQEESQSSAGRHAFYESNAVGDYIEFPFVAEQGIYQFDLRIRQFNNRGIAKVTVDGVAVAQSLDFYNLTSRHIDTQIGQVTLDNRATHTIRFEVTGKNAASTNYILGLDAMYLTKQAVHPTPKTPTNFKSGIQSDTTVNLEWSAPIQEPDVVIDAYEIYQDDVLAATIAGTKTFYTITGLIPGTSYVFKIRSISQNQVASEFSQSVNVTTLSGKQVYEFEQLVGYTHSGDRLTMQEESKSSAGRHAFYESNAVGDYIEFPFVAEQGIYQLDLRIRQFNNRGIAKVTVDGVAVAQSLDFYNLTSRYIDTQIGQVTLDNRATHTIRFEVTGKNPASSNYILGLDAMYLTKQVVHATPKTPTNFKSGIQSDTTVNLEWSAPTQEPDVVIDAYEIYQDDVLAATIAGTKTFYTITGLIPGTSYVFKIRSISQNQVASEFSLSVNVTTLSGKQVYEFEQLVGYTHSGDRLTMQEESKSSAGRHAFYESNAVGDYIEFPFVAEQGRYQLDLRIRQFNNRGIAKVTVDGVAVAQSLDLYNLTSRHIDTQIGQITLDNRATHTIRFEVTGKNTASSNYILGLDAFYLTTASLDTFEPNDTPETATPINVSQKYESYISSKLDKDFYKFTATENTTYFFTLQSPSDHRYKVEIFNSSMQPSVVKKLVDGRDVHFSGYMPSGSFVYIRVSSEGEDYSFEPYRLRVSPASTKQYFYDDANRLIKTEYFQGLYKYQIQYIYDRNGNLLNKSTEKTVLE